ncbi:MAG: DMT family transporter [Bacteroidetes bacterium]|nr:DMT family transporter [Bacteroidota bacterium]
MKNKKLAWALLVILSVVWGSSFILMKRGLDAFSSDEVAALRISIAFLFLSPLLIKHYKIDFKKYLPGIILMGVFGNLIPAFLFTKAETEISSSLTGMLNALTPLFTVLVGLFWLKVKPKAMQIVGIIVGFIGAACLMIFDAGSGSSKNIAYGLLVVAATFFYAISVCGIKKYLSDINSITATVWAFSITGPISLIYLFGFSDFTLHLATSPMAVPSLGYISILAIVGSALSVIAYNILIKNSGTVFASSCTYLIPVVAIGWGLFDGEMVNFYQFFSIVVIILSVYLINRD